MKFIEGKPSEWAAVGGAIVGVLLAQRYGSPANIPVPYVLLFAVGVIGISLVVIWRKRRDR